MCRINKTISEHTSVVPLKDLTLVRPNHSSTCKGLCVSHFYQK